MDTYMIFSVINIIADVNGCIINYFDLFINSLYYCPK